MSRVRVECFTMGYECVQFVGSEKAMHVVSGRKASFA
jgi:hypothetical protein